MPTRVSVAVPPNGVPRHHVVAGGSPMNGERQPNVILGQRYVRGVWSHLLEMVLPRMSCLVLVVDGLDAVLVETRAADFMTGRRNLS